MVHHLGPEFGIGENNIKNKNRILLFYLSTIVKNKKRLKDKTFIIYASGLRILSNVMLKVIYNNDFCVRLRLRIHKFLNESDDK